MLERICSCLNLYLRTPSIEAVTDLLSYYLTPTSQARWSTGGLNTDEHEYHLRRAVRLVSISHNVGKPLMTTVTDSSIHDGLVD